MNLLCLAFSFYHYKNCKKAKSKSKIKNDLFDLIGNTPIVYLKELSILTNCKIYVQFKNILLKGKCEFMNPGGSLKDRTCKSII